MDNTNRSTRFSENLPPTPYPFDVSRPSAVRGKKLFNRICADCHAPGNENILPPAETGTDPYRSQVLSPYTLVVLREMVKIACSDPITCFQEDGTPFPDAEILRITGGYMAVPLDGIWARAPYLHNGSVPTLRALLTGERPAEFYRGNTTYDQGDVGYTWDEPTGPNAALYDTALLGNSNAGHQGPEFFGDVDFANSPRELEDILEFLKTL
jgi:hypothetical protein